MVQIRCRVLEENLVAHLRVFQNLVPGHDFDIQVDIAQHSNQPSLSGMGLKSFSRSSQLSTFGVNRRPQSHKTACCPHQYFPPFRGLEFAVEDIVDIANDLLDRVFVKDGLTKSSLCGFLNSNS